VGLHDGPEDGCFPFVEHLWHSRLPSASHPLVT
jgi:hypothetical protein